MGLLKDFKDFAIKGNAMDLAVGVIIGAAFGKIVSSLVENIFMPIINPVINRAGGDWRNIMLGPMKVGAFGGSVIDFVIIAFVIFLVVKGINSMKKETVAIATEPSPTEKLLAENQGRVKEEIDLL